MQTSRQLTTHFLPEHYDLSLSIHRKERTFSGTTVIAGVARSDGSIWLHAKDLEITDCRVNDKSVNFVSGENDEIELKTDAKQNDHVHIAIAFEGTITDQMHGMYPCYFQHDGSKKELIATQFESHHAREVFPCIDEPDAKATFDVTLTTEQGITVLGNMPIKDQRSLDNVLVTSFETTPRMSSYLLAWVCGEMHKKSAVTASGVEVNVWATPAQSSESLTFALDIATRTVDFFDDYFGIPYPLPKCDHVALPDFSSGAMENWGLITYREVALLAEPGSVSVSSKHRIAAVIAHELSHQWFGNLVTMKWWNNLWLNESFANFMEYVALDALEPSWNVWFDFAGYETVSSLRRDATDGVQAVQTDVNHPDEISTLFDPAIVYAKGSRLLHMLEQYIGREAFRDGLQAYFKQHAYKNTSETDLWEALSISSGQDISALMTPWISQPGYPVIHVDASGLKQRQFFIGDSSDAQRTWPIPLGASDEAMPKLLDAPMLEYPISPATRLNTSDSAHFITHYPAEMMNLHLESVRAGTSEPISRLQLLHEQTLLARGHVIRSAALVPILSAYKDETIESVWDIMALTLGEIKKFVEDDIESEAALRSMSRQLALPQFERLGWTQIEGELETDTKLRATVIGMMLYGEDPEVIRQASEFASNGPETIDPELRAVVLGSAVRHAPDDSIFEALLELHATTSSAELQQDIASSLTSTKSSTQIQHLLELITDPKTVRTQDVARWFVYLIRNRYGRDQAWQWLQHNWGWIETTFGGDKSYDDYPRYAASGLISAEQLQQYRAFFEPLRSQVSLTRVIDMGISELKARVELVESDKSGVRAALLNQ
ncbi:M1 family metallopeptidase [Candidatus Saccharibacteria bacterium]|nr:M1 family metallopeptidase [Candidatus Saccharibacteria bacterium]